MTRRNGKPRRFEFPGQRPTGPKIAIGRNVARQVIHRLLEDRPLADAWSRWLTAEQREALRGDIAAMVIGVLKGGATLSTADRAWAEDCADKFERGEYKCATCGESLPHAAPCPAPVSP